MNLCIASKFAVNENTCVLKNYTAGTFLLTDVVVYITRQMSYLREGDGSDDLLRAFPVILNDLCDYKMILCCLSKCLIQWQCKTNAKMIIKYQEIRSGRQAGWPAESLLPHMYSNSIMVQNPKNISA